MDVFKGEFFLVFDGSLVIALELPDADVGVLVVVAEGFAIHLVLDAEVTTAGLVAVEGVVAHQLGEFEVIGDAAGALEFGIELVLATGNAEVAPEFLAQGADLLDRLGQTFLAPGHAALVEQDVAELDMDGTGAGGALDRHHLVDPLAHFVFGLFESGVVDVELAGFAHRDVGAEVVADDGGHHEVAVGQTLHEGGRSESVGSVVGEITLTGGEEAGDGGLKVVVHPEAAHGVVGSRVDHHRLLIRRVSGDVFIHVEEVAVAFFDDLAAEAVDGIGEVKIDAEAGRRDAAAIVAGFLGGAGGDVPWGKIAETRVFALEEVVAIVFRHLRGFHLALAQLGGDFAALWDPDAPIVAEGLRHEGELGLVLALLRDAGRVNLGVAGIGETGPAAVGPPSGGHITAGGVGGKEEHGAVSAGGQDHGIRSPAFDLTVDEVTGDDAFGDPVDEDDVEHLMAVVHFDLTETDLTGEALVGTKEELLAGLTAGIESAADLGTAEGAVVEHAAVFAGKGHALSDTLVNDSGGQLGQAVHIGFAAAVVPALDGVVEEAVNAVTVVAVVLGGVDPALGGDGVGAAWAVLVAEALHVVAQLAEGGGGGATGQAGPDHDHAVFALVGGVDQLVVELGVGPLL